MDEINEKKGRYAIFSENQPARVLGEVRESEAEKEARKNPNSKLVEITDKGGV